MSILAVALALWIVPGAWVTWVCWNTSTRRLNNTDLPASLLVGALWPAVLLWLVAGWLHDRVRQCP